jgi:GST-like protein
MIDLYAWGTPNGMKIPIFLEEAGLPYRVIPVHIGRNMQFEPEFLKISPNNKIPAIVDNDPADDAGPIPIFESGAILLYLAEKTGTFLPQELRARTEALQWLFWQVGGLGPMAGQNGHFNVFAKEKVPYAQERYIEETRRLYGVLDRQLEGKDYIAGEYSIADMASYPWILLHEMHSMRIDDFPNVRAWYDRMANRPAVQKAYAEKEQMFRID